jgi:hypothetical protein
LWQLISYGLPRSSGTRIQLVFGVALFRWWLLGDTGFLEDGTRELDTDDSVIITRLGLVNPKNPKPWNGK